jgi:hypothetical protein
MATKPIAPGGQGPGHGSLDAKVKRMNSGIYVDRVNVDWGMPYSFTARVTCRAGAKGCPERLTLSPKLYHQRPIAVPSPLR